MKNQIEISNIAKETIEVLNHFDEEFTSKISKTFLNNLYELSKNSNIKVIIDENKELKDQNISEECKDLLSILYYKYIATEEEKTDIIEIWKNNDILYKNSKK